MLAVLKPGREAEAEAIFKKWELDFAVIGITTDTHRLVVKHKGKVEADMPITALSDAAPVYERPYDKRAPAAGQSDNSTRRSRCLESLKTILGRAGHVLAPLGVGAIRLHRDGRHGAAARRRCGGGARAWQEEGRSRSRPT